MFSSVKLWFSSISSSDCFSYVSAWFLFWISYFCNKNLIKIKDLNQIKNRNYSFQCLEPDLVGGAPEGFGAPEEVGGADDPDVCVSSEESGCGDTEGFGDPEVCVSPESGCGDTDTTDGPFGFALAKQTKTHKVIIRIDFIVN